MWESITPEAVGQEFAETRPLGPISSLHLEPVPRNPERRDYQTRANFAVFSGDRTVCRLIAGADLGELWKRSRAFAAACPEIACRPLFWRRGRRWEYLGFEHFDGRPLDRLAFEGIIGPGAIAEPVGKIVGVLERTRRPSHRRTMAHEIEELFTRVSALPLFGGFDHQFLREVIFPFVRHGAMDAPCEIRWTNGDFVSRNVLVGDDGSVRLVDYEFAGRTHFSAEDWWRWRSFSRLPSEALDLPALRGPVPPGSWLEAFFILRQLVLAFKTNCTHLVASDSRAGFERLTALASAAHLGFRSSVFLAPMANLPRTAPTGTPGVRAATARLCWSRDGTFLEEACQRIEFPVGERTRLHFQVKAAPGSLRLRVHPVEAVGLLQIEGIRIHHPQQREPLLVLEDGAGWNRLRLGEGLIRLVDSPALNLLSLNSNSHFLLPEIEAGRDPVDLSCEVWVRYTPDLTALPDYCQPSPTTSEIAGESNPEGTAGDSVRNAAPDTSESGGSRDAEATEVGGDPRPRDGWLAQVKRARLIATVRCAEAERRVTALEADLVNLRRELEPGGQAAARLEHERGEAIAQVRALEEAVASLRARHSADLAQLQSQTSALAEVQRQSALAAQGLSQAQVQLADAARRERNLQSALAMTEARLNDRALKFTECAAQVTQQLEEILRLQRHSQDADASLQRLQAALNQMEARFVLLQRRSLVRLDAFLRGEKGKIMGSSDRK